MPSRADRRFAPDPIRRRDPPGDAYRADQPAARTGTPSGRSWSRRARRCGAIRCRSRPGTPPVGTVIGRQPFGLQRPPGRRAQGSAQADEEQQSEQQPRRQPPRRRAHFKRRGRERHPRRRRNDQPPSIGQIARAPAGTAESRTEMLPAAGMAPRSSFDPVNDVITHRAATVCIHEATLLVHCVVQDRQRTGYRGGAHLLAPCPAMAPPSLEAPGSRPACSAVKVGVRLGGVVAMCVRCEHWRATPRPRPSRAGHPRRSP
jgi:hypothetical protein